MIRTLYRYSSLCTHVTLQRNSFLPGLTRALPVRTNSTMASQRTYDDQNIFAKILRGEIPNKTVYEDEHTLIFHDISPLRKVHVLLIPKGKYVSFYDFSKNASESEIVGFIRSVSKVSEQLGIHDSGFRAITNHGHDGGQEVPHFHVHLVGGERVGHMLSN